jgi:hypothetical protein
LEEVSLQNFTRLYGVTSHIFASVRTSKLRNVGGTRIKGKRKAVMNERGKGGNQTENSTPPLFHSHSPSPDSVRMLRWVDHDLPMGHMRNT